MNTTKEHFHRIIKAPKKVEVSSIRVSEPITTQDTPSTPSQHASDALSDVNEISESSFSFPLTSTPASHSPLTRNRSKTTPANHQNTPPEPFPPVQTASRPTTNLSKCLSTIPSEPFSSVEKASASYTAFREDFATHSIALMQPTWSLLQKHGNRNSIGKDFEREEKNLCEHFRTRYQAKSERTGALEHCKCEIEECQDVVDPQVGRTVEERNTDIEKKKRAPVEDEMDRERQVKRLRD